MKKIIFSDFSELLTKNSEVECNTCEKQKYLHWGNITTSLDNILEEMGEFEDAEKYINKNGCDEYHPNGENYWSDNAIFALQYYPYHASIIRKCPDCAAIFLSYMEGGGHAPQHRLRWVNKDLVYYGD